MAFDPDRWKDNLRGRLAGWWSRAERAGATSVYAGLSAAALWPLVEAARKGELMPAVLALGAVTRGVGASLIAGQIERWKTRLDGAGEAEITAWVEERVAGDAGLRNALDDILDQLEAVNAVQAGLGELERRAFGEALRADLERLGNLARFEDTLSGAGAIAQGKGAVAAGAGGVAVGGGVRESVIAANIVGDVYIGSPARGREEALSIYRRVLASPHRHLPLRGVDVGASDPTASQARLDLARVYVDLETRTEVPVMPGQQGQRGRGEALRERDSRPLRALEAAVEHDRVVILGDPGSGKSTFVNHLALCLAMHALEPDGKWLGQLQGWPKERADLVPIPVTLRDFARGLPDGTRRMDARQLWEFIERRLKDQNLVFAAEHLHAALETGKAIVLLDGVDEIPTADHRRLTRDAVAAFADRYPASRYLASCRTLSYQDRAARLEGFEVFELASFDGERIDRFIGVWYEELGRLGAIKASEAAGLAAQLREAVRRPDLWRLSPNPLLLTVMALVHAHRGRLPDARAQLYEETVDILLWRWDQLKAGADDGEEPRLRRLLLDANRADVDLRRALWRLAFDAHGAVGGRDADRLADIGEARLLKEIAALHPSGSYDWARQVVDALRLRAGLLLERAPQVYTFPHRTFQEYLAGAHLSTQGDFARLGSRLLEEGVFWRLAMLLAVGRLVYVSGDVDKPLALAGELSPVEAPDSEASWRRAWLAGEVLAETGIDRVRDSALGRDLLSRARGRLVALLRGNRLSPVERANAGTTLASLGDPRFRTDAWSLPDEDLLGFVEIAEGRFLMGSDAGGGRWRQAADREASADELPQHPLTLPTYYIARHPITVAQWRAFVEDRRQPPSDPDRLRGVANHPVVEVSWYEAMEYCAWLTEKLRAWAGTPELLGSLLRGRTPGGKTWRVILPSEAQWEKAARGQDGRIFPWGNDEPDPDRANFAGTGIGTTSAVGCFPRGASPPPYGVEDLSGNVWEWTRSLWGKGGAKPDFLYPYVPSDGREDLKAPREWTRVLRGGAFGNAARSVRCAFRDGSHSDARYHDIGFRVVVSPFTL